MLGWKKSTRSDSLSSAPHEPEPEIISEEQINEGVDPCHVLADVVESIERIVFPDDQLPAARGVSPGELEERSQLALDKLEEQLDQSHHTLSCSPEQLAEAEAALNELRDITTEQASFLQEANSAADRMQSSIVENSRLASSASEAAAELSTRTETRTSEILSVVSRLQTSSEQAAQSLATVFDVGNSSNEIAKMAQTINEIAEQTKILALNAAIAAARAGDKGREFGVISSEIRELATRTADTARNITRVIGVLEGETRGAVSAMEQVDVGLEDVDEAGDSLRGIASETSQLVDSVDQISTHSKSQSAATSDVLFGIDAAVMTGEQLLEGVQRIGDFVDRLADTVPLKRHGG